MKFRCRLLALLCMVMTNYAFGEYVGSGGIQVEENVEFNDVITVREDRIWKYRYQSMGEDISLDINVESYFAGEELMPNGKIYSCFKTKHIPLDDTSEILEFPDYYLREDNGTIYLWLKSNSISVVNRTYEGSSVDELFKADEWWIIDFNTDKWEASTHIGISTSSPNIYGMSVNRAAYGNNGGKYEYVDINGEKCKSVTIRRVRDSGQSYTWVQGIGLVGDDMNDNCSCWYLPALFPGYLDFTKNTSQKKVFWFLIGFYDKFDRILYNGPADPVTEVDQIYDNNVLPEPIYYDLYGCRIKYPETGRIYIEKRGVVTKKVIL